MKPDDRFRTKWVRNKSRTVVHITLSDLGNISINAGGKFCPRHFAMVNVAKEELRELIDELLTIYVRLR